MSSESEKKQNILPKYSWEEIAEHKTAQSLWVVIQDKVYDVTRFMEEVGNLCQMLTRDFFFFHCSHVRTL